MSKSCPRAYGLEEEKPSVCVWAVVVERRHGGSREHTYRGSRGRGTVARHYHCSSGCPPNILHERQFCHAHNIVERGRSTLSPGKGSIKTAEWDVDFSES